MKEAWWKRAHYLGQSDLISLEKAFEFASRAHDGQKRATGEPYMTHPVAVCSILMEEQADLPTLMSALLHDVVEDTDVMIDEVEKQFGQEVSRIVDGLTKVERGMMSKEEHHATNMQKLLSATADDVRVAVVKIADRLHNMRTLDVKPVEKQIPYANEALIFFAPLAGKLGLRKMRAELEEISFPFLNPVRCSEVVGAVESYSARFDRVFQQVREKVGGTVTFEGIREPLYQSYSLLQDDLEVSDLYSIRITTDSVLDCYSVMGSVHQVFTPVTDSFVDHLALPVSPYNQELRTKVWVGNDMVRIILQTREGKALSDQGVLALLREEKSSVSIQRLSHECLGEDIHNATEIAEDVFEFEAVVSHALFQETITIYTPDWNALTLPAGATIVDYVFAHSPIGEAGAD
ncbi:HD domain-containing protein [Rossellomorea marisflavi]|uniref:HD domain-containing protein n=1 Tax=Rossellomorea marisflavi TaxID=189381 RepID=UPI00203FF169|nr:HD domain-containing protein [Rossellomorea marisflavi]MCM2587847.1 HD domain-containing protein [Rossellomorea marisflavi]